MFHPLPGAIFGDVAVTQEYDSMRMVGDFGFVGHENDRMSGPVELVEQTHDFGARRGIEIPGRLVGEQDARLGDEGPRDRDTLALSARHLVRPVIHALGQADALERAFGAREARKMDRFTQFATVATMEALGQAGLKIDESNRDRVGIVIGTGIGGIGTIMEQAEVMRERGIDRVSPFLIPMMISDSAAGMLAIRTGARGPNMSIATACATGNNGHVLRRGEGVLELGAPADFSLLHAPLGGAADGSLAAIELGDLPSIAGVVIDGELRARRSRNTPAPATAIEVQPR